LHNKLQELSEGIADIYELKSRYSLLAQLGARGEDEIDSIADELYLKECEYQRTLEEFTILSIEYARNL